MGMHVQACMRNLHRSAPRRKHYAIGFQIVKVAQKLQPATVERRRQYALLCTLKNDGMCLSAGGLLRPKKPIGWSDPPHSLLLPMSS